MQNFIAIGRLVNDPEISTTNSGITVTRFNLAVERNRPNKDNELEADFFNTIVYGKIGENCAKYLKKGSQIAVIGQIQNRSYNAKDGTKRYITEIVADMVRFLSTNNAKQQTTTSQELTEIDDTGLPF